MKKTLFFCFLLLVLRSGMVAQPTAITYQGKLLDAGGNAITQNNMAMNFAMFDAPTGGSLLWPASGTVAKTVDIAQGLYSVQLGTGVSGDPVFTASMFNGKTPWLEVKVGTSTLSRTPFTNVPFALISNELGASGWASPGAMGSTTPNIGKFTTLRADTVSAATFNGELKGNAATASSLKGGSNGALPYQSGAGATAMLAAGADGNVLTLASGVPSWAMPLRNAVTVATTANPAPTGNYAINEYYLTALAEAAAFAAPSGTPANGNTLLIRILDNGTARSLTWDAVYTGFSEALPLTTLGGKNMYCRFIFNSTSGRWQLASLFIQDSCIPSTPVAGTHTPSGTQIIWKWHSVPGATGYKWGTTNDFIAATDMSTDTVKTETGLNPLTPYTRYVWAYNSCGISPKSTLTQENWICGIITDSRDGKVYTTVRIGTQCWMKQNLNVGNVISGTGSQINNDTIEKYCYGNNEANCTTFGGIYQWSEAMQYSTTPGVQGICPTGWHLPTDAEWCTLTTFLDSTINCSATGWSGTDAGGKIKETGTTHWTSPNQGATNSSLFYALGGGHRDTDGSFQNLKTFGNWWSSTQSGQNSWYRGLYFNNAQVYRNNYDKLAGFSVRCLKD